MKRPIYACLLILLGPLYGYPSIGVTKPDTQAGKVIASIRMPASFQAGFVYARSQGYDQQGNIQEGYEVKGEVWVKGNKYRLVLEDQIVVSNGKTVWNYVPSLKEVQIYDQHVATTDGDMTSLSPTQLLHLYKHGFVPIALSTTIIDQKKSAVVQLIPEKQKGDIKHLNLVIDQESHQIRSVQVLEKDDILHHFSIVNLTIQDKLNDFYFEFQMPADPVEVVDLR